MVTKDNLTQQRRKSFAVQIIKCAFSETTHPRIQWLAAMLVVFPTAVYALPVDWVGPDGAWETASNWSSGALPTGDDFVQILDAVNIASSAPSNIALELLSHAELSVTSGMLTVLGTLDSVGSTFITSGARLNAGRIYVGPEGQLSVRECCVLSIEPQVRVSQGVFNSGSVLLVLEADLAAESFDNFGNWTQQAGTFAAANSMINHAGARMSVGTLSEGMSPIIARGVSISGSLTNYGLIDLARDTLSSGSTDNYGTIDVNSGSFRATSMINGGTVDVRGVHASLDVGGVLTNRGELSVGDGARAGISVLDNSSRFTAHDTFISMGTLTNFGTGDVLLSGDTKFFANLTVNYGDIEVVSGSKLETRNFIQAAGRTTLVNGTLGRQTESGLISQLSFTAGVLDGVGQLDGTVMLSGSAVVAPGSPSDETGSLVIAHDVYVTGGTLAFDLDGLGVSDFDRLLVGGTVNLGGTLLIQLGGGVTFALGDHFDIIVADGIGSVFDTLILPSLDDGLSFSTINGGTYYRLAVVAAPVPLPAPVALLTATISLLLLRKSRA